MLDNLCDIRVLTQTYRSHCSHSCLALFTKVHDCHAASANDLNRTGFASRSSIPWLTMTHHDSPWLTTAFLGRPSLSILQRPHWIVTWNSTCDTCAPPAHSPKLLLSGTSTTGTFFSKHKPCRPHTISACLPYACPMLALCLPYPCIRKCPAWINFL